MAEARNLMIPGPVGRLSVRTKGLAAKPKHVLVLCQGSNCSGQMGYDFSFPAGKNYSLMDALVEAGIGAVTFSIRGYALSDAPEDPFTVQTDQAIEDLAAVLDWVRDQGFPLPHLLGWSWGGRITGRYVEQHPDRVDRLVLMDPALGGNPVIPPAPNDPWWENTYDYYIDRLEAEYSEPAARVALARRMESEEPRSPNGIRLEGSVIGSIAVKPTEVTRPTLMLYGSNAAKKNYMQGGLDRLEFFQQLATDDKQFTIVPGCGDYAHLQIPRQRLHKVIADFLLSA